MPVSVAVGEQGKHETSEQEPYSDTDLCVDVLLPLAQKLLVLQLPLPLLAAVKGTVDGGIHWVGGSRCVRRACRGGEGDRWGIRAAAGGRVSGVDEHNTATARINRGTHPVRLSVIGCLASSLRHLSGC